MVKPINWNRLVDEKDKEIWDRLTSNFWLDTKVPLAGDLATWDTLKPHEKLMTMKVFAGLTALDTLQSETGMPMLMPHALTPHEGAVLANIDFMEAVHAKSYSSIFSTLSNTDDIDDIFHWANTNKFLQYKANRIKEQYMSNDGMMIRAASVCLESFLFYSGFYLPLHWASRSKLTNTADLIRLIIRDESVHGYYIGYKFQQLYAQLTPNEQKDVYVEIIKLINDLYHNEVSYVHEIYDESGLAEDVKKFLHYNINKAMHNLGFEALFDSEETAVNPAIIASLSTDSETHDFFSGSGSSYVIGKAVETSDDDWDF